MLATQQRPAFFLQPQGAKSLQVNTEKTPGNQLAVNGAPLVVVQGLTHTISHQVLVLELGNFVGLGSAQHIDEMIDTKALPSAIHCAQSHSGRFGAIPCRYRLQAIITISTGLLQRIIEVSQQGLAPAAGNFTQPQHGVQAMLLGPFVLLGTIGALHHLPQFDHIL